MIQFDHRVDGTPEQQWHLDDIASLAPPAPGDAVLVVSAHPDDESLGVGALIASCTRLGVEVRVVVATDGDASHPDSPTHTPQQLAAIRRDELRLAVAAVAPDAPVEFLGLPDGRLAEHASALGERLDQLAEDASIVVSPWIGDRHPDHEACGHASARAAARAGASHWQYPIWAWHWADPRSADLPREALRRLDVTEADRTRKRAALACHRSQHAALSDAPGDEAILTPGMLAHFDRPAEYVIVGCQPGHRSRSVQPGYLLDVRSAGRVVQ